MMIYTFAPEPPARLFAYAGDRTGASLPERHGPWKSVGQIGPSEKMRHGLDRAHIEQAIFEHGYQMWRLKQAP